MFALRHAGSKISALKRLYNDRRLNDIIMTHGNPLGLGCYSFSFDRLGEGEGLGAIQCKWLKNISEFRIKGNGGSIQKQGVGEGH